MKKDVVILIAEDEDGHFELLKKNIERVGSQNQIIRLVDGQEASDFFFKPDAQKHYQDGGSYILMLDIRMPKINGLDLLKKLKQHPEFKKVPTLVITTADDPADIQLGHGLACSIYIVKPVDYFEFTESVQKIAQFFSVIEVPTISTQLASTGADNDER